MSRRIRAYCLKCSRTVEVVNPRVVKKREFGNMGARWQGKCPQCGEEVSAFIKTESLTGGFSK